MKKSLLIVFSLMAVAGGACSSKSSGGDGGSGGVPIPPDPNGYYDGTNQFAILGSWYSYGDWYDTDPATCVAAAGRGTCALLNYTMAQCSSITTPIPGQPFTNTGGAMVTTGVVAQVIDSAYSAIWGAGIGMDFNNPGVPDGGACPDGGSAKAPYNATAHGIKGFAFDLSGVPTGGQLRVEFPFGGQYLDKAPYWKGDTMNLSPIISDGHYEVMLSDVAGPMYLMSQGMTPPTFDPTTLVSMQFHVVANTMSSIPYNELTVSNLVVLQ